MVYFLFPVYSETDFVSWGKTGIVSIVNYKYLTDTCLCSVLKVYQEPLTASLNSNRAILSYADIHIVLSPVTQILELNRYTRRHHTYSFMMLCCVCICLCGHYMVDLCVCVCVCCRVFQADLQARLQQWGAEQCIGDVCVKLCSNLRVYTNYFNNYTTALCTIDKVRCPPPAV